MTNEGSLVETYHRGAFIASLAGGISSVAYKDGVHLTPSFQFKNLHQSLRFVTWVRENDARIKEVADSTSRYGRLLRIQPILLGRMVYLNFFFKTGDASGLNMINIASDAAARMIVSQTNAERYYLRSNLSSDKKPSFFNFIAGYGKEVITEVTLPNSIVKRFLRTTSKDIFDCWYQGFLGSVQAGMLGPNGQFANGLGAMFLAFGQDVAQIVNASSGILTMEIMPNNDLKVYCKFPQLIVATVGGGTALPFSKACLEMVDCVGEGKALKLAEIMAAVVTAGEISLRGAIASGEFANSAHTVRERARLAEASQHTPLSIK
jgi:hydroxymethylglutaryl-CoA reductase (NADPH)